MHPLIQLAKATPVLVVTLVCVGFFPTLRAVSPPPDGGYPGGNTAEGQNALFSLTTGGFNTAGGFFSLRTNSTGQLNTAIGAGTLLANTADENTATGAAALLNNTIGFKNTATGTFALFTNTTGIDNTADGASALRFNSTGHSNTATGANALSNNTTGSNNTASGDGALANNTTGFKNTATGFEALFDNTTGVQNTAEGHSVLSHNTTGTNNTASGFQALLINTTGGFNTATGINALVQNTTGSSNTALGDSAGFNVTTADHVICIGANVQGEKVSNTCYIGNIFGVTSTGGAGVFVNDDGKLGTATSSRRFKEDIQPMDRTSEALFSLKPVSFHYKKEIDPAGTSQFGLVAEDVEKVNRDLVVRDKDGKPYTVRYEQVNAMLLNEFLKEHRTIEQQRKDFQAALAQQQKQIDALATGLQKVSAQLELSNSVPQTVLNNR